MRQYFWTNLQSLRKSLRATVDFSCVRTGAGYEAEGTRFDVTLATLPYLPIEMWLAVFEFSWWRGCHVLEKLL